MRQPLPNPQERRKPQLKKTLPLRRLGNAFYKRRLGKKKRLRRRRNV
jgi:hypothetical protein